MNSKKPIRVFRVFRGLTFRVSASALSKLLSVGRFIRVHSRLLLFACLCQSALAQVTIVEVEGKVQISRAGSPQWDPAYTNQVLMAGDRIRTLERSRASLRLGNQSPFRLDERSVMQIPAAPGKRGRSDLLRGAIY